MDYKNDDIEFANRLLTRREELNDEEVTAWLKEKDHVELLDEIAAIRQKLSGQNYGENDEEEFLHLEKSIYDQKSRPDDFALVDCRLDYIVSRFIRGAYDKRGSGYA